MTILHTHRRGLLLLERAHVHADGGQVVYATEDGGAVREFNIPTLNTTAVILGQGASLTQAAARRLSDDEVMVAFAGSGGTPLFLASQDCRPTERFQAWVEKWPDTGWRLSAAKSIQSARRRAVEACWAAWRKEGGVKDNPGDLLEDYEDACKRTKGIQDLMVAESVFGKKLCAAAARGTKATMPGRAADEGFERANSFLELGNYLAYGMASVVLWAYGLPPQMPVTHGVSRVGGLVFDVADAIKDAVVLPTAFECAVAHDCDEQGFRDKVVGRLHSAPIDNNGALGFLFDLVDGLCRGASR